jgi:dephospho-CoA kinase
MKRIGLTGNIGTGKSTVARIFEILGIPVYKADLSARAILHSDIVKPRLISLFGDQILDARSEIDRKALGEIVFNDKTKLLQLNNLIHPLVEKDFEKWCSLCTNAEYVIHEAAILFESGFHRLFDTTILVTAPVELCIERVMERDSISRELVTQRLKNQWPQAKKQELSGYIVINDGETMVIPQVLIIHSSIRSGL